MTGTAALKRANTKLELANAKLRQVKEVRNQTLHNSLSDLVRGAQAQTSITSFMPALQNNIYAPLTLNFTLLMYMYKTHGVIQTAIDMPVLDALRGGLDLHSDELDGADQGDLEDKLEELGLLTVVGDAMNWARLFGGGAVIVNCGDPEKPLTDADIIRGPIEFYDACRWELGSEQRIPKSGFYDFYGKRLHASRVITLCGKRAPYQIRWQLAGWGMSEVEKMLEDFNVYIRNKNVIYELLEEAKVDVYRFEDFKSQLATAQGTALATQRVELMNQYKNFNNALVLDKMDEYDQKQMAFSGLADMMKEARIGMASALRMPMTKLFGLSATGFDSGEDDIENYNAMVESEVRTPLRRPLRELLHIAALHTYGARFDIDFKYRPLRVLGAVEEEAVKTSKHNRYLADFDRGLLTSKELGEIEQKENMVPIMTQAAEGKLDDFPEPQGMLAKDDEAEGGQDKKDKGDGE